MLMGAGYEYSQCVYIQTITDPSHTVRTRLRRNNTESVCGSEKGESNFTVSKEMKN